MHWTKLSATMGKEIERKYLVENDDYKQASTAEAFHQSYIDTGIANVRIRIEGEIAKLTIKSKSAGLERLEFEYDIPLDDAKELLGGCCRKPAIEKIRHTCETHGKTWVVDEFKGSNRGLTVAEVELESVDETVSPPPWIGQEVTHEKKYYNEALQQTPFTKWPTN